MRKAYCALIIILLSVATSCTPTRPNTAGLAPAPGAQTTAHGQQPLLPGPKADGFVLLHNQWSLHPVGQQVELADFPINVALHPNGQFAAVLHSGVSTQEILVVDIPSAVVAFRTNIHEAFYGIEFSKDGRKLFCSGAGDEVVHCFDFQNGVLSNHATIKLREARQRGVPAGLALDSKSQHLWAANVWGDSISQVDFLPQPRVTEILVATNAAAHLAAPVGSPADFETAAATKRAEATLYETSPPNAFPYVCRLDEKRQRLYVSLWGQAAVLVIDLSSNRVIARWPTDEHPCEMALTRSGKVLFVANANRNTVTVFDTQHGKPLETLWAALYPKALPGSTPNSLALSPDEKTLFVADAGNNLVAVFDVSKPGKSCALGFIPVGWYPTSVRVTPDGKRLIVANGKGVTPLANPLGPQPGIRNSANPKAQYIGRLFRGALSIIDLPPRKQFEQQLETYTAEAYRCSPLNADASVSAFCPPDNPIPRQPGAASPIKYVVYVIKENRTYDQVLGDMPQGNGDPKLCLFPERVTPNEHKLAGEFVLLDNFYADAEVSADGHEWSMGAYATDFVQRMWRFNYGHNSSRKFSYPAEGMFPIACPSGGYIWDRAREAGVSYRSYGEFVQNGATPEEPATSRVPALLGHIDEWFQGFDLNYLDVNRADRFVAELKRLEIEGDLPRLQIVRLPGDHTHASTPRFRTPAAYVGDNDLALGRVVEAITHSKFWAQTAIFVVEDDAQNGPDHVDAHRTTAFVISPYTKRGAVDSTMYSTSSMLRTIELILGLSPMTQFDAAATPMFNAFQPQPDLRPYQALPANVDLDERNTALAWGGRIKMDFSKEDAVDDLLLNEVIWRSVRGTDNPMPTPVRAAFVFAHAKDVDD